MIHSVQVAIRHPEQPDRTVTLTEGVTQLGRSDDNELTLEDVGVSRRHARILLTRDQVRIEDLGSGNGTWCQGAKINTQSLFDGDEVVIDPFVLRFTIQGLPRQAIESAVHARLDILVSAGMQRDHYHIGAKGLSIGRSEDRDVIIPDPAASRHHCNILQEGDHFVLRDVGSANGIYLNARRVRQCELADGDHLRIGNTEMRFVRIDPAAADSTTLSVNPSPFMRQPLLNDSMSSELSLPIPESTLRTWLPVVASAIAAMVAMGVIMVGLGTLIFLYSMSAPRARVTHHAPAAPVWVITLPGGLPAATITDLFELGTDAMRSGNYNAALEHYYRILHASPGNAAAERFAYAAGEGVLFTSLKAELDQAHARRESFEKRRAELLDTWQTGTPSEQLDAQSTLNAEYADDPVVRATTGWSATEAHEALQRAADDAAGSAHREEWASASDGYRRVQRHTDDPVLLARAEVGLEAIRNELARQVAVPWHEGIHAELNGDVETARARYHEVLAIDPTNPSASARMERLSGSRGDQTLGGE